MVVLGTDRHSVTFMPYIARRHNYECNICITTIYDYVFKEKGKKQHTIICQQEFAVDGLVTLELCLHLFLTKNSK